MDEVLVAAWLAAVPAGPVHRVRVEHVGHFGARRMETLCGIRAAIISLADDEPVSCARCLTHDGEPAVRMAEYLLVDARKRVTARLGSAGESATRAARSCAPSGKPVGA